MLKTVNYKFCEAIIRVKYVFIKKISKLLGKTNDTT